MEPTALSERPLYVQQTADARVDTSTDGEFNELYLRSYRRLVVVAYSVTESVAHAEEVVQDAYLQLLRRWDRVENKEAWLRRAVVSLATSWLRRQIIERRVKDATRREPDATACVNLRLMLTRLTPRQRAAVVLRYYEGLSEREIALALSCRAGTVKSLLSRAMAKLKEEYRDADRS